MIEEYFESVKALLQSLTLSQSPEVDYDYRDRETGFLKGDLVFKDGSRLHFREFVQVKQNQPVYRYMYAFQYMKADGTLIFRYDDTKHFPHLSSAPHHKHIGENEVVAADAPDLQSVLKEIEALIKP
ncbi:MAG: hypothetical protein HYZ24_04265 [Chloroflexi bacterium]|nr:hypothetical protein [Chloroflexota bacterium]